MFELFFHGFPFFSHFLNFERKFQILIQKRKKVRSTPRDSKMQSQPTNAAQTKIFNDTNASKRKRNEDQAATINEKRQRKENWEMDDDHSFLQLVRKYKFSWDQVKNDLQQFQHRRTDDTEESLEKHWKNLAGPKSKYGEGKEFEASPFKSPKRKLTDIELEQAEAAHEESV